MKNNIATLIVIVMLAVMALPAAAQQFNTFGGAVAPQASFQSTSTMRGSGSSYSSNPMISSNGTAVYSPSAGPHRAKKEDNPFGTGEGEQTITNTDNPNQPGQPIGDAVLPLMLCALVFCGVIYFRRRRANG